MRTEDPEAPQYLVWGGEQGDQPCLVDLCTIQKDLENAHWTGLKPFTHIAHVGAGATRPVTLAVVDRWSDSTYIHVSYTLRIDSGTVLDTFTTKVNGLS